MNKVCFCFTVLLLSLSLLSPLSLLLFEIGREIRTHSLFVDEFVSREICRKEKRPDLKGMKIQRYRSSSFPCEPIRVLFPTHSFIQEIRENVREEKGENVREEKGENEEAGGLILPTHSKGCHLFWFKSFPWVIYGFSKSGYRGMWVSLSAYSKFGKLSLLSLSLLSLTSLLHARKKLSVNLRPAMWIVAGLKKSSCTDREDLPLGPE